jgi:hypothetical protein
MSQTVLNFLRENKYFVSLTKASDNTFCLLTPDKDITIYQVLQGRRTGVIVTEEGVPRVLQLPECGVRLTILCDLIKRCRTIGYNEEYVVLFDGKTEVTENLFNFLPEPISDKERLKEIDLLNIFYQAAKTNFLPYYGGRAREKGVYAPYYMCELYLKEYK